jgi:hydroxypyruvate isomerase
VRAAVEAGFDAIEFGFPSHADLEALAAARDDLGVQIVLFNQDVPNWDRRNRGYLADPRRRSEFRRTLDQALSIAKRLGVAKVMLPAGVEADGLSRAQQRESIVNNLSHAAPLAEQADLLLTIEVLNSVDNPGYFLTSSREAVDIVREVNHPRVKFQFDTYHLQMIEGDLLRQVNTYADWIGHFQFADYPGRHEPGTGEIDFGALQKAIETIGYQGHIGLEYKPSGSDDDSLAWLPRGKRKRNSPAQEIM